ncbi:MAG: hypothetical protein IKC54_05135 [Clostridia bacterium]|nr:hypothetical protein [Clostridia bacterium]
MMDLPLADDKTMALMSEAYTHLLSNKQGHTLSFGDDSVLMEKPIESGVSSLDDGDDDAKDPQSRVKNTPLRCARVSTNFLVLYFALFLMYNSIYGTAISYTNSRMGGVQPQKRPFGDLNGLF